jgi:RNA polymerase sigma-70 factor, ECF subfamily
LADFPESVFSWPLVAPAETRSPAPLAPESEVLLLFEELRHRLLHYLLALGLSPHDGEEIIQESFLLLFRHLQNAKPRDNLRGWVFRVARNLALKLRARNRRHMLSMVEFGDLLPEQYPHPASNPEEQLHNKQRRQKLLAIVRALPERDQSCLYMSASGLTYREIAKALGISLGSVATSLARSLAKLSRADGVSV